MVKLIERPQISGPLEGIKILDFTRLLPGPLASMLLADMGAEVIKIESPLGPDYLRNFKPSFGEASAFYYALNRNKQSLAVDHLTEEGKEIIISLVKEADVLIEQFRPGAMKHFGLDYETLSKINSRLIYASITGYGQNSSKSKKAGHDLNYIALTGLLGSTGMDKDNVAIPGGQIADIAGGSYMTMNAILGAIIQRGITNLGQHLDIAMADCILPLMTLPFSESMVSGQAIERGKFQLAGGLGNYNVYQCKDDKFLALACLEEKFWKTFCDKIGKNHWIKIHDHELIKNELRLFFKERNRNEWLDFFANDDICITEVNEPHELSSNDYLKEKNLFVEQFFGEEKFLSINHPIKFQGSTTDQYWIAPKLGEDSASILKKLALTDEQIEKLTQQNIIKTMS